MRTVVNAAGGSTSVGFHDVDPPAPERHEVLVTVHAFSVNRGELGLLARRPEGWRPGQDVAGVVREAAADGSGPQPGARVVGLVENAGWSEQVPVSTDRLAVLPDQVSVEQAATLPIAGLTALRTLRLGGDVLGGRVLVTGASGAVGRFQIQLARARGADVTAVSSPTHARALRDLGAAQVVDEAAAAPGLFDVISESVGGRSLTAAIDRIAPGGTVVVIGNSSGEPTTLAFYDFIGHEGARLQTFMSYASPDPDGRDLALLVDLVGAGRLQTTIAHQAGWSRLDEALAALRDRRISGKAVLTID